MTLWQVGAVLMVSASLATRSVVQRSVPQNALQVPLGPATAMRRTPDTKRRWVKVIDLGRTSGLSRQSALVV